VLQSAQPREDGQAIPCVSHFVDFSIYVDAGELLLQTRYVDRFLALRETLFAIMVALPQLRQAVRRGAD
jgi:type I pantothenate kinase